MRRAPSSARTRSCLTPTSRATRGGNVWAPAPKRAGIAAITTSTRAIIVRIESSIGPGNQNNRPCSGGWSSGSGSRFTRERSQVRNPPRPSCIRGVSSFWAATGQGPQPPWKLLEALVAQVVVWTALMCAPSCSCPPPETPERSPAYQRPRRCVSTTHRRSGWTARSTPSTPTGEAMASIVATFAQLECRLIGQRTREALAAKRAAGAQLGRPRSPERHRPLACLHCARRARVGGGVPPLPERRRGGSAKPTRPARAVLLRIGAYYVRRSAATRSVSACR